MHKLKNKEGFFMNLMKIRKPKHFYMEDFMQDMHEEMDEILESGSYEQLEQLRDEYNMPIMHWVESEEEFNLARQMHERYGDIYTMGYGGCH